MKKHLLVVKAALSLLLLSSSLAVAQPTTPNLVINGDFEQRNSPPHGPGRSGGDTNIGPIQIPYARYADLKYWNRTQTVNSQPSVPAYIASDGQSGSNTSDYGITAHNSPSCIFIGRHDATGDKSHDDFVTQELSQPLSAGHLYHVEFWTLRLGSSQFHTKLAISITSNIPTYDGVPNSLIPSPGSKVLISPDIQQYYTWVRVAGDITIPVNDTGNNKWFTIGNDRSDQTYDPSLPDNGLNGMGFAIDDVSLVDMGCATIAAPRPLSWTYNVPPRRIRVRIPAASGATSYNWYIDGSLQSTHGTFTDVPYSILVDCDTPVILEVEAVYGTCVSQRIHQYFYPEECQVGSSSRVAAAYPNPATESISIPADVTGATLVNDKGKTLQRADASGKLNVQAIPDGLYNLQMMQNGKLINQRIQIKH